MEKLLNKLEHTHSLSREEWTALMKGRTSSLEKDLYRRAEKIRKAHYGNQVYIRGLIEFTNICKNDCYYCGIRKSNRLAHRYRLSKEEILECCAGGYELGFRTFVLQGGEDVYFTPSRLIDLVSAIRNTYPDCAITLSIGEMEKWIYQELFDAGANRYLLRHETFDAKHYKKLHPAPLSAAHRRQCLWDLKDIGYQIGTGFMVGSPYQTPENLADDMLFLEKLNPQMVGIGPFITHKDTPFSGEKSGTLPLTLFMLALIRLALPKVLLPATTALGTIHPKGRQLGILAGANVVMPNLSPQDFRKDYSLYDNKICTNEEAAEGLSALKRQMASIGYEVTVHRGDSKNLTPQVIF